MHGDFDHDRPPYPARVRRRPVRPRRLPLAAIHPGHGRGEIRGRKDRRRNGEAADAAQYKILRKHGTERPFTSSLDHEKRKGIFACAGCDLPLFSSETKYDSGTGWPSFYQPLPNAIGKTEDRSLMMVRTEVHCARCGGHLGHVFDDGPKPTGLRYCMNGLALTFKPANGSTT